MLVQPSSCLAISSQLTRNSENSRVPMTERCFPTFVRKTDRLLRDDYSISGRRTLRTARFMLMPPLFRVNYDCIGWYISSMG
jgi:hypothetical protein